jgi:hypothetical protein
MRGFADLEAVTNWIVDWAIYTLNGFLAMIYWLVDHLGILLALACAVLVVLFFDTYVQKLGAHMPSRPGQRAPIRPHHNHQILTAVTAALWAVAAALFPVPVPWLGAGMWGLFVVLLLLLPAEQLQTLWRSKTAILIYALALLGFRWYLSLSAQASPREWAALYGTAGEAQRAIASTRGLFATIGTWVVWFALPVTYAGYGVQRLTTHAMSLADPRATAAQIVEAIRTRGVD